MDSGIWKAIIEGIIAPLVGLGVWWVKKRLERAWAKEDIPAPPAPAPAGGLASPPAVGAGGPSWELRLISHMPLFYWWPVWMVGFIVASLAYWEDGRVAVVPGGSTVEATAMDGRYSLILPPNAVPPQSLQDAVKRSGTGHEAYTMRAGDNNRWYGPVFLYTMVIVLMITNLSFRGVWSFVLLMAICLALLILTYLGGWQSILVALSSFQIQINAAGYLFLATSVFALWLLTTFVTDQQRYLIITPTEVRVRTGYRPQEVRFSLAGVVFEKAEDDLLRHWRLGFYSGDLIVRAPNGSEIYFPNVLWLEGYLELLRRVLGPEQVPTHGK